MCIKTFQLCLLRKKTSFLECQLRSILFLGGRYEFTSRGQLYIRHVTQHDNMQRFKCHAIHRVTKVKKYSPAARLQIHG